jgi:hypothetical protein
MAFVIFRQGKAISFHFIRAPEGGSCWQEQFSVSVVGNVARFHQMTLAFGLSCTPNPAVSGTDLGFLRQLNNPFFGEPIAYHFSYEEKHNSSLAPSLHCRSAPTHPADLATLSTRRLSCQS